MKKLSIFISIILFMFLSGCNSLSSNQTTTKSEILETSTISTNSTITSATTEEMVEVSFNSMGGTEVGTQYVSKGSYLEMPTVTRVGYNLDGWYTSLNGGDTLDEKWSFNTDTFNTDIVLYAKWNIETYDITYNLDGGTNGSNPETYTVETPTITLANPAKEGYTFDGWFDNAEYTGDPITDIALGFTGNITLYAKWTINEYTITFNSNGGSLVSAITQDYNTAVVEPTEPTREGYTFGGWYSDEDVTMAYSFNTMPAEDIILYAKWNIEPYDITYNLDGGINGNNPSTYTVKTPTITLNNPTKEEYTFDGWYDNTEYSGDPITEIVLGTVGNITLYAKWTINQYTITYTIYDNYDLLNDIPLHANETVTSTSLGDLHSAALTSEGRVFTWGWNYDGELGVGTATSSSVPIDITSQFGLHEDETVTLISLGEYYSSAVTSENRVFIWGYNGYGEIGDGTTTSCSVPIDVTSQFNLHTGETVTTISLGGDHSLAMTSEGRLFTWGANWDGQLGDGTTTTSLIPIDITSQFGLHSGETITSISSGSYHSSAITSESRVFTWGSNNYGQLGDGTTTDRFTPTDITSQFGLHSGEIVESISLGDSHTSVFTSESRVFTWGYNHYGQLGDSTTFNSLVPIDITNQFGLHVRETITSISLGAFHSSAITSEGRTFIWGFNLHGELGDGTTSSNSIPAEITSQFGLHTEEKIISISLGGRHSTVITSEGRVFIWGYNYYGQLGDGTTTDQHTPINMPFIVVYSTETAVFDFNESLNDYIPVRAGYTFDGWYSDEALTTPYIFSTMPAEDITLYGRWIEN